MDRRGHKCLREVGLSIVVSSVYPLLDLYFRPKPFERGGRLYEWMGVLLFKRFVVWLGPKIGVRRDRPNAYFLWDRSAAGISAFERKTRRSEVIHFPKRTDHTRRARVHERARQADDPLAQLPGFLDDFHV